jgi:hypothetical protein
MIPMIKVNYLLAIPLLGTENFHVVDLGEPSKYVCLHLKEYYSGSSAAFNSWEDV